MKAYFCFILTNLFVIIVTSKSTTTIINSTKVSTSANTTLKTPVNSSMSALCKAEITRKNLIAQLTTAGQKTINQLLVDVQFTTGVSIQHLISSIHTQFSSNVSKIMNSSDSSRMVQLSQLLCFGNATCGAGPLQSVCSIQTRVDALVSSFSAVNRDSISHILSVYIGGLKAYNGTVLAIVGYFDAAHLKNLRQTENATILNGILPYSYIYSFY
jgi:hypothetical protein